MPINWIEAEHLNEAAERVLETCLWNPAEITDGSEAFEELTHTVLRLYACGKSRADRGDLILAAIDEYLHDRIKAEAEKVIDEQREDEYLRRAF